MKVFKNRIFLAVICIFFAAAFMIIYAGSFNSSQKTITAYKAKAAIAKGMLITDTMLSPVDINPLSLHGVITDKEKIVGETAAADLAEGQLVFAGNLGSSSGVENLEQLLDGSHVAYSISVDSLAAGVSGSLVSGDIVSVYTDTDGVSKLPPELTYVPVLFTSISDGENQAESEEKQTATVTLLVTPTQALILNKYEYTSKIHLALVYRGNPETAAEFVDNQEKALKALTNASAAKDREGAGNGE